MRTFIFKRMFKAISSASTIPKIPTFPTLTECCENECDNCVWVEYFNKNEKYRKYLKNKQRKSNTIDIEFK